MKRNLVIGSSSHLSAGKMYQAFKINYPNLRVKSISVAFLLPEGCRESEAFGPLPFPVTQDCPAKKETTTTKLCSGISASSPSLFCIELFLPQCPCHSLPPFLQLRRYVGWPAAAFIGVYVRLFESVCLLDTCNQKQTQLEREERKKIQLLTFYISRRHDNSSASFSILLEFTPCLHLNASLAYLAKSKHTMNELKFMKAASFGKS